MNGVRKSATTKSRIVWFMLQYWWYGSGGGWPCIWLMTRIQMKMAPKSAHIWANKHHLDSLCVLYLRILFVLLILKKCCAGYRNLPVQWKTLHAWHLPVFAFSNPTSHPFPKLFSFLGKNGQSILKYKSYPRCTWHVGPNYGIPRYSQFSPPLKFVVDFGSVAVVNRSVVNVSIIVGSFIVGSVIKNRSSLL